MGSTGYKKVYFLPDQLTRKGHLHSIIQRTSQYPENKNNIYQISTLPQIINMPRNGDGSSDNGPFPEADHNIGHGVTNEDVRYTHPPLYAPLHQDEN